MSFSLSFFVYSLHFTHNPSPILSPHHPFIISLHLVHSLQSFIHFCLPITASSLFPFFDIFFMEQDSAPMDDPLSSPAKPRREDQHTPSPSTLLPKTQSNGFLGKHRMAAAISNLQNQINFLQVNFHPLLFCAN